MRLVIITPVSTLLDVDDVVKVRVRLDDGSWLSIYERHAPVIAAVIPCDLQYMDALEQTTIVRIGAGVLQLAGNTVTIYVNQTHGAEDTSNDEGAPALDLQSFDRLTGQLRTLLGKD